MRKSEGSSPIFVAVKDRTNRLQKSHLLFILSSIADRC
ncbi:hypothetical protein N44_02420 [Microcystis aeruginosa NIES-44]|uniref:Uncharacterized protein n=1 Tax=Microcystis aeruginosa NIES-44 TaxID=449439 RepID=A0A0A1VPI0_MICAE|nr:hypothetical protein N44_02420 [Microcystis aeruginosa NIES-44]